MARFKMVDGVRTQLTSDEEKARDADKKKWADYRKLLRDLPGTLDDTKVQQDISWPSAP